MNRIVHKQMQNMCYGQIVPCYYQLGQIQVFKTSIIVELTLEESVTS